MLAVVIIDVCFHSLSCIKGTSHSLYNYRTRFTSERLLDDCLTRFGLRGFVKINIYPLTLHLALPQVRQLSVLK